MELVELCLTQQQQEFLRKKNYSDQEEKKLDDMYVDINTAVLVKMRELEGKGPNVSKREKASYIRVGIRYGNYLKDQQKQKQPGMLSRMANALSPSRSRRSRNSR